MTTPITMMGARRPDAPDELDPLDGAALATAPEVAAGAAGSALDDVPGTGPTSVQDDGTGPAGGGCGPVRVGGVAP